MRKLSPRNANTFDKVCSLQTDHKDLLDYWIIADDTEITIAKQRTGEPCEVSLTIPRADFNKLINWYLREQDKVKP